MKPKPDILRSAHFRGELRDVGLRPANRDCTRCERPMYLKLCPCFLRRAGWQTCAKCPKCGKMIGLQKKATRKRKK